MECQSIDLVWLWSCAGLGAQPRECGACAHWFDWPVAFGLTVQAASGLLALIDHDGTARGEGYCSARGEILRPLPDQLQRRRSASACSSIKNESVGSEDDQTPS